ncbi:MAG: endonuclease [Bacteroidales bacterium]
MRTLTLILLQSFSLYIFAQAPEGYYSKALHKNSATLKTSLHQIIKGHTERTYTQLWTDFQSTDKRADGKVWDMYSTCSFTYVSKQCGSYKNVCDCYNREHSFPKSWFNEAKPMYSDLYHLYPTDGKVNGQRSNYPYGECAKGTQLANGKGKLGTSTFSGYSGTVFEPDNEFKGDLARTYFYMVTRYDDIVANWASNSTAKPTLNGTKYPAFTTWTQNLLLKWHREDPVSQKEIDRNNAVYKIQNNRNPFIDHPELAEHIWGKQTNIPWTGEAIDGDKSSPSIRLEIAEYLNNILEVEVEVTSENKIQTVELWVGTSENNKLFSYNMESVGHDMYHVKLEDEKFDFFPLVCTIFAVDKLGNKSIFVTHIASTGIDKLQEAEFRVFPNPASTELHIHWDKIANTANIEVFNTQGQIIYRKEINSTQNILSLNNFAKGLYYIRLSDKKYSGVRKFTVAN